MRVCGLFSETGQGIGAETVVAVGPFQAREDEQNDRADTGQRKQSPPAAVVDVVKPANAHAEAWKQQPQPNDETRYPERRDRVEDVRSDDGEDREERPEPVFRPTRPARKIDV